MRQSDCTIEKPIYLVDWAVLFNEGSRREKTRFHHSTPASGKSINPPPLRVSPGSIRLTKMLDNMRFVNRRGPPLRALILQSFQGLRFDRIDGECKDDQRVANWLRFQKKVVAV